MKHIFLTTSAAFLALSLAVHAGTDTKDTKDMKQMAVAQSSSDAGFYVGVYGGANFSQDNDNGRSDYHTPLGGVFGNGTTTHSGLSDELGGMGGLKAGYKFQSSDIGGGFALQSAVEAEAMYLGTGLQLNDSDPGLLLGNSTSSNANVDSAAFFVNGILNLKTPWHVTPYFGAGIGGEYISITDKTLNNQIFNRVVPGGIATPTLHSSYSDNDVAFAVQALAGVNYDITPHWTVFAEYKFVAAIDPYFTYHNVYTNGDSLEYKPDMLGQHVISAGLKYNF